MEKISSTDRGRNEVLYKVKEDGISYRPRKKGHNLRRKCLLKHVTERKIEEKIDVTERRGRRSTQLLYDLKERTGYREMKEEGLNRTL
jgi:hypothetical protein